MPALRSRTIRCRMAPRSRATASAGLIGEGGFGVVYRAWDDAPGRHVAIKEYMPESLAVRGRPRSGVGALGSHRNTFEAGLKSFLSEARLLARFGHPRW